jgi:insertion element IS1 protein InsB
LKKFSLAGIARATGVSEQWLQNYVNSNFDQVSQEIKVSTKKPGKLLIECDEPWSYVGNKNNKQWIWLALDKKTREIVGCYIGERGEIGAKGLWNSLPHVYRQCACYFLIFGRLMDKLFRKKDTNLLIKKPD